MMEIYLILGSSFLLFLGIAVLLTIGWRFRRFRYFVQVMIVAWSAFWSIQFGRGFGVEDRSFLIIMGLAGSVLGLQAAWLIHRYGNTRPPN
jgi:hypothetical protein